ncbi:MAG: peptide-methionine (S)-S-oxide reductase MsrA [Bacteroidales bacterium]|nr:peptide-methionine (S)-S-oxide reductase MsrA [Bacteroidales bacterium]MBQ8810296.1 peptide-methionine (S)-S-oxide reductase MsrA [Bacteroidales bacterium]MBQ9722354.1 peptide-methionine (S)-S-oxide reductase MsrA [Bacteroidales bacterium]
MIKSIYFAGGCFWGTEHFFKQIEGVTFTETGYANGSTPDPTYRQVYTDTTGYAETVHVEYDNDVIDLEFLVRMFFRAIDPTSLNRQGEDVGTRYRTGIYYTDAEELPCIKKIYDEIGRQYESPLVVELEPLKNFYRAEDYHQDYLENNPDGYCHLPLELFEFARKARK